MGGPTLTKIGHNKPPGAIELAADCFEAVGRWLVEHPVLQTEEEAREAKSFVDRGAEALREMEAERDAVVRPLNEQVRAVNETYRTTRNPHEKVLSEIKDRLRAFIDAEEQKRLRALEEAQRARELAEQEAREAEAKEQEAKADAKMGVESDVAKATVEADAAFSRFTKADRAVARAEKDAHVKVGGGFGKALSVKRQEVLIVDDWKQAIETMGMTDKIREAILSSARDFRKVFDELPDGVSATHERRL